MIVYIFKKSVYYKAGVFLPIGSSSMASVCGGSLALMDAGKNYVSKLLMLYIYLISIK